MVLIRRDEGYWRKYVTAARAGLIAGAALIVCAASSNPPSPSVGVGNEPPKPPPENHTSEPKQNQQGTQQNPLFVQVISSSESNQEPAKAPKENSDEAANWWLVRLTFGLIIVGLIQAVVFWVQANRLKQTIAKMDEIDKGQTAKMTEYIAQATRNADATNASAEANKVVAAAAKNSAEIANRALTTLERPFVYCSVSKPGIKTGTLSYANGTSKLGIQRSEIEISVYNFGRTPARLTRFFWQITLANHGGICPPVDPFSEGGRELPVGTICVAGDPFLEIENLRTWFAGEDHAIASNQKAVWLTGFIRYDDIFGIHHINGFALVFDTVSERFVRRGGESYNYESTEDESEIPMPSSLN